MSKQRNGYFDFLKGLAIMGVVAIHTMVFRAEPYSLAGGCLAAFRNLLGSCVPFFVAVSGYFLCNKVVNTKESYCTFVRQRFKVVYVPILVWGLPWLVLNVLQGGSILANSVLYLVGGLSVLYFIALILELYVQLPLLQRVNRGGYSYAQ